VTVVDFKTEQFNKDKRISSGDMRDLSFFQKEEFELVYQTPSINFISCVEEIFNEVARLIVPNGLYVS
jgi:hypothetical protein